MLIYSHFPFWFFRPRREKIPSLLACHALYLTKFPNSCISQQFLSLCMHFQTPVTSHIFFKLALSLHIFALHIRCTFSFFTIHNCSSQLLFTIVLHNYSSQLLFTITLHNCSVAAGERVRASPVERRRVANVRQRQHPSRRAHPRSTSRCHPWGNSCCEYFAMSTRRCAHVLWDRTCVGGVWCRVWRRPHTGGGTHKARISTRQRLLLPPEMQGICIINTNKWHCEFNAKE